MIRLDKHLLRFYSLTQRIISLGSGQSEFYAMTKGAAIILGFQSIARDWGLSLECVLFTDSAMAKCTVSRLGAGSLRHIDTPYLWLQQVAVRRALDIRECKGTGKEADLGTKTRRRNHQAPLGPALLADAVCGASTGSVCRGLS